MYARHGYLNADGECRHRAGKHVTMTSEIVGEKLIAVVYSWSSTSLAYFISTCGVTTPAAEPYVTSFEDESGEIVTKSFSRPRVIDDYYNCCTVIDDHNKYRQAHLALEKKWRTQNCWARLTITLIAMAVTNFYRIAQAARPDLYESLTVRQFVARLCKSLEGSERSNYRPRCRTKADKRDAATSGLSEVRWPMKQCCGS